MASALQEWWWKQLGGNRKTGWRSWLSLVYSMNLKLSNSRVETVHCPEVNQLSEFLRIHALLFRGGGSIQWNRFIIAGVIAWPHRPGLFSGKLTKGHVVRLIFCRPFEHEIRTSTGAVRERKTLNTLQTRFRIGSMNKMFTAVAILRLVQAGKLRLDVPLGKYLTDYPNKDVASKVNIEQLLTHTGGTGDIFGPEFDAHRLQLRTLQDFVKLYGNRGLRFEPASRWEYSNYGFILLGVVIEKVSGQNYCDYVREHVYVPAVMSSTGSEPEDEPVPDRSVGYTAAAGTTLRPNTGTLPYRRPNTDSLPYRGSSAGGGYSTVQDLLSVANALQENRLVNAQYTEMLTTGKIETTHCSHYAYGFEGRTINGLRRFGHAGGAIGMNGDLEICPDVGYVVVILANLDPPAAARISDFITNRLTACEQSAFLTEKTRSSV
jgi:D-alanyl-D-alanine carboxypeptidase